MTEERRTNNSEWPYWMHNAWNHDRGETGSLYPREEGTGEGLLCIGTLEGQQLVSWGDYIIRGVAGEIYPCKPDIFEKTYESVCEEPTTQHTDTELLNGLQKLTDGSNFGVRCRQSFIGRGWRLHEDSLDKCGGKDVRKAIAEFLKGGQV